MLGLCGQALAADQWLKTKPDGTESPGTIDNLIRVNQEALDRLVINYKRGLAVNQTDSNTLSVLVGELAISNSAGSITRWRRTTTATTVNWSDIDTGAEANSTQYYVYATADTDITGMVFKISTSSTAPSGATYYRKIAEFYNSSAGAITHLKSLRNDDGADYPDMIKGSISFNGSGTIAINDHYNVSSITDNGTGDYTITWNTAFSNANYSLAGMSTSGNIVTMANDVGTYKTTTYSRIKVYDYNGSLYDATEINVIATGDRA